MRERMWDGAAQGVIAPSMSDAMTALKSTKLVVPTDFTQLEVIVAHNAVVSATLQADEHGVTEQWFLSLEASGDNKSELNYKFRENKSLPTQFLLCCKVQINEYAKSVENNRRIRFPTFSTLIHSILTEQFLPQNLPPALRLQLDPRQAPQPAPQIPGAQVGGWRCTGW